MLQLEIDYTLTDDSAGTFGIAVLNKNTKAMGRIQYSVEAMSGSCYGSLDHYWAWSESHYTCIARIINDKAEFLRDHLGRTPVEAMEIRIAGVSPYGGSAKPSEMSRITLTRTSSGTVRVIADGAISRGVWPLSLEKSNEDLPNQVIALCLLCSHHYEIEFAACPALPPLHSKLLTGSDVTLFLEDYPFEIAPWVRAFVSNFYPMALHREGQVIDRAAWDNLVLPSTLYHHAAAVNSFQTNTYATAENANSNPARLPG